MYLVSKESKQIFPAVAFESDALYASIDQHSIITNYNNQRRAIKT